MLVQTLLEDFFQILKDSNKAVTKTINYKVKIY